MRIRELCAHWLVVESNGDDVKMKTLIFFSRFLFSFIKAATVVGRLIACVFKCVEWHSTGDASLSHLPTEATTPTVANSRRRRHRSTRSGVADYLDGSARAKRIETRRRHRLIALAARSPRCRCCTLRLDLDGVAQLRASLRFDAAAYLRSD